MVLLSISKKLSGLVGPFLLRNGLSARNALLQQRGPGAPQPYLDVFLLIPFAQKIISLDIYDQSAKIVTKFKQQSRLDKFVDRTFDSMFGKSDEEERLKKATVADIRLQVYEDTVRPALLYNEVWSDVMRWRFHPQVVKWARSEFLIAKFGPEVKDALDAYPQLRASPQLATSTARRTILNLVHGKRIDFGGGKRLTLPSSGTLIRAFRMQNWSKAKDTQRLRRSLLPLAKKVGGTVLEHNGKLLNYVDVPEDADLAKLSMDEVLELCGGHAAHCGSFNAICEEAGIYQMWTEEYIRTLARYLMDRTRAFPHGDTVVLDVGAGDGLLVRFLNECIEREAKTYKSRNRSTRSDKLPVVVATDDGSWGILIKSNVEKLDMKSAISKYRKRIEGLPRQLIVLCSWMPSGVDWTSFFRESDVDEYILIGEADDGSCGRNWETWGNVDFQPDDHSTVPPFIQDGYTRRDMDDLTQFQFSRFDSAVSRSSKTVSFRRSRNR